MIPLRDDNPTSTPPIVTITFIAANVLIFLYQLSLGEEGYKLFALTYGAIPYELMNSINLPLTPYVPNTVTVLSSIFLHGGLFHLGGNMLYLWIFGNNIEDSMGHIRFIIFYLICGIVAVFAHTFVNINSKLPMIGASGAISGILGAYLLLFPRARVVTLVPIGFFIQIIRIPAVIVIGFWIVIQFLSGAMSIGAKGGGVAYFAHIGGFISGIILVGLFKKKGVRLFGRRREVQDAEME
ncbi:MAG: rhomboid family intramembrane serine protease [Nitrospirota bacterium]